MSDTTGGGRFWKWIDYRLPIFTFVNHSLVDYPTPRNLNYWWSFGSMAGILLVLQIVTGIVLSMHYTADVDTAFDSVEHIMRDVNYGWLLRYLHANGASIFFAVVYIHIFRGLYYGSYKSPREVLWWLGILILLCMMATAFLGYVLPWGQMSYWAAKVITSLFSAIPLVGESVVEWLWGGYSVGNPTLGRFYSLHYLLPFVIVALVFLHLWALHRFGSNNPLGIDAKGPQDKIPFHPYYTVKDLFGFGIMLLVLFAFVFYAPNYLGHPDNYIPADQLKTPEHIVPEWYFLPFYAILRAIDFPIWFVPAKLLGVVALFASVFILFVLPWLDTSKVRSARFRPIYKQIYWLLIVDVIVLGIVGAHAPNEAVIAAPEEVAQADEAFSACIAEVSARGENPDDVCEAPWFFTYLHLGQIATFYYFFHFLVLFPLIGRLEKPRPLPTSISEPVLPEGGGAAAAAREGA